MPIDGDDEGLPDPTERQAAARDRGSVARVQVFVNDEHLRGAIVTALEVEWDVKVIDAGSHCAARPPRGESWDVCVADRESAEEVLRTRGGRGLVVLEASAWLFDASAEHDCNLVVLRIPCTMRHLREAVRGTSGGAQPTVRSSWDGLDADPPVGA